MRELAPPVAADGCGTHLLDLTLERRDVAVRLPCGLPRRQLLERPPYGEHREQLLVAYRAHPGSAERLRLDESQQLEVAQRLPHGRLARAELAGNACLDQALARLQLSAKDAFEENFLDLLAKYGSADAHGARRAIIDARFLTVKVAPHQPATTGFVSDPTRSISIVTSSPGRRSRCGSRKTPTPAGVPVRIRSPGSNVNVCDA